MTFELRNGTLLFQRLIDAQILHKLLFIFVYIDDVLITDQKQRPTQRTSMPSSLVINTWI